MFYLNNSLHVQELVAADTNRHEHACISQSFTQAWGLTTLKNKFSRNFEGKGDNDGNKKPSIIIFSHLKTLFFLWNAFLSFYIQYVVWGENAGFIHLSVQGLVYSSVAIKKCNKIDVETMSKILKREPIISHTSGKLVHSLKRLSSFLSSVRLSVCLPVCLPAR